MLKSNHAQSFIRQLEDEGFEGLMGYFKLKKDLDGDPTVNQNLLQYNLTQLQGYRKVLMESTISIIPHPYFLKLR